MERKSNIELLRIVSMLMIMTHHFIIHALYPNVMDGDAPVGAIWLNALCYVAVNCFVLISGYFTIRLSWRRILSYLFMVIFYAFVINLAIRLNAGGRPGKSLLISSLFPLTHNNHWWFITQYTMLMLISPLLNAALKAMDRKAMRFSLICLLVADVYIGWWGNVDNGYSIFHFITLYVLGNTLRQSEDTLAAHAWLKRYPKAKLLAVYLLAATLWAALVMWQGTPALINRSELSYNHPLVMLGAAALFCLFLRLDVPNSKAINRIAQSAIAAYLLQDALPEVYPLSVKYLSQPTTWGNLGVILLAAVAFYLFALVFDQLRLLAYRLLEKIFARPETT